MNNCFVCVICCEEFRVGCDGEDLERKEENVERLKQLCEVILEVDKNGVEGNGDLLMCFHSNGKVDNVEQSGPLKFDRDSEEEDGNRLNDKFSKFLNNPDDNLSICGNCLDLIKTVSESRLSAKCVEQSVEKLQVLVLRELRRLQGRLELFWGEFQKMEATLDKADLKLIGNNLDGSYSEVNDGGKRLSRSSGKIIQVQVERKKEIFGFREKISQVFRDFRQFKKQLNDKIACDPDRIHFRANTVNSSKISVDTHDDRPPEKKRKIIQKPDNNQPRKNDNKGLSLPPKDGHLSDNDEDDNDGNMDDEPMHHDNLDDNDNFSEDNQVETRRSTDKRASLRRRNTIKKYEEDPSDSDEDHDNAGVDNSEDYKPEVRKTSKQVETEQGDKRRRGRPKKQDKQKSSNSGRDHEEQNSSDEEYRLDEPDDKTIIRAKIKQLFQEYEPHLSQMPPFKRNVIKGVLKCQFLNENRRNKKGADKLNVFQRHMTYLSYNVETQLINLKDIPIKILCQEGEDGVNGLLCMKCDFKVDESPKMQNLMWEHVLSKHLNAYQCPHCTFKEFQSYPQYHMHVYRCFRRREQVDKVDSDICGKSLSEKSTLQYHKWFVHMSDLEKKEALESGLFKKAPTQKSTKGMPKKFQCEHCGKSFISRSGLEDHEITHRDRDSREQFICSKCGKSFLKEGYEYHCKYSVSCGEDDNKETCDKCGKIFKNKMLWRRHVKEMHEKAELIGDSKLFVCATCGKAFGRKRSLIKHQIVHSGDKPWICGNCGMGFNSKYNMNRHEKTCKK